MGVVVGIVFAAIVVLVSVLTYDVAADVQLVGQEGCYSSTDKAAVMHSSIRWNRCRALCLPHASLF